MRLSTPIVILFALAGLGSAPPTGAQERATGEGWRISAGGGVGASLYRGDDGEVDSPAGVARLSIDRSFGPGFRLGLEWMGSWMEGSFNGESRHHVGVVVSMDPGQGPVIGRLGLGLGTATVVDVEGPPSDGVGDVSVGIGDTGGLGAVVGAEVHLPLTGGLRIVPGLDVLLQRSGGHAFATGMLTARLLLGAG